VATILTLSHNYKNYKLTYDALFKGSMVFEYTYGGLYYFSSNTEKVPSRNKEEIVFFEDEKNIKLLGNNKYLHRCFIKFDPYSYYWHRKLWKWFNENKLNFKNKEI